MNIEHYIRIGRLLAELHGDEVLSEQQCAKIMGVDLVSWRIIEHTFSRGSWGETVDESGPTSGEAIRAALSNTSAPSVDAGALTLNQWIDIASRHANRDWNGGGYLESVQAVCADYARASLSSAIGQSTEAAAGEPVARPVTPLTCPKCNALWLFWPKEQSGFEHDSLNLRSEKSCDFCEPAGADQLKRLNRVEPNAPAASGQKLTDEQINAVQWAYECVSRYNYQKGSLCHRWTQTLREMCRASDSATASDKEGA